MIPEIYRDNTTIVKNHTQYTHYICVLIRMMLGSLIVLNKLSSNIILIISVIVIIGFFNC